MTNSQKKVLAVLLAITFPIWVVPIIFAYVIITPLLLIYANIADAMEIK